MIRHFKFKSLCACVVTPYTHSLSRDVIAIDIYVRLLSLAWARSKKKLYSNCIFHTTASVLYGKTVQ